MVSREAGYEGFLRVDRLRIRHRLFEGGVSDVIPRELLVRPMAVGVLLYDPVQDAVVMVRQVRIGLIDEQQSPWILELVAGMVDTDESPEQVARRECEEEANCTPGQLEKVSDYFNSPGVSNERVIIYCGQVDSTQAGGVFGLAHEHEDIAVEVIPLGQALAALEDGAINNAMSIIALQWLALNKGDLKARWA